MLLKTIKIYSYLKKNIIKTFVPIYQGPMRNMVMAFYPDLGWQL